MSVKVDLLIIDAQIDFCDPNKGSLYVKGAEDDMKRVATMIERIGDRLNDIHVTMDSHRLMDIAHPLFWKDSSGKHPDPFTIISVADVTEGKWTTSAPKLYRRAEAYVKALEKNQRYPLCIWPPHCLIGREGHNIIQPLADVLLKWEEENLASVDVVTKGSNPFTEHYSCVRADVPDPNDVTTQVNTQFIQTLMNADIIVICGEAGSHCVRNSILDICTAFGDDSYAKKIVLLKDAMSPVVGFENLQDELFDEMKKKGAQINTTTNFLK